MASHTLAFLIFSSHFYRTYHFVSNCTSLCPVFLLLLLHVNSRFNFVVVWYTFWYYFHQGLLARYFGIFFVLFLVLSHSFRFCYCALIGSQGSPSPYPFPTLVPCPSPFPSPFLPPTPSSSPSSSFLQFSILLSSHPSPFQLTQGRSHKKEKSTIPLAAQFPTAPRSRIRFIPFHPSYFCLPRVYSSLLILLFHTLSFRDCSDSSLGCSRSTMWTITTREENECLRFWV